MKIREPTLREIEELVSYLPQLYAEGFAPIKRWSGGTNDQDDAATMPWPEYDEIVLEFYQAASSEWWSDYGYTPEDAAQMLKNDDLIKSADLAQIKTMLTYCVRGERFHDGHWAAMIKGGHIRRLLQRLSEILSKDV